jgi:hypothetical protein
MSLPFDEKLCMHSVSGYVYDLISAITSSLYESNDSIATYALYDEEEQDAFLLPAIIPD